MLVGLLVHLVTCGYVLPTIRTMNSLFERNHVDVSIARHFVTEVSANPSLFSSQVIPFHTIHTQYVPLSWIST